MTQDVVQPSAPPAPPQAPARVSVTIPGADGTARVLTSADLAALQARKDELSRLLRSADSRRKEVQRDLRAAVAGPDRAGLEQRLGVLDARIARLESEIDANNSQLASLDATRLTTTTAPPPRPVPRSSNRAGPGVAPFLAIILVIVLARAGAFRRGRFWRRGWGDDVAPADPDTTQRLERMEQAMEAIAIEVERISEGQRFVTRLMSEGQPPMERVPLPQERYTERG